MERQSKGLTLADGMLADLGGARTSDLLGKLDDATPWETLVALIRPLYRNHLGQGGRPNIPVLIMVKIVLLQRWFGLSDPAMEEAISDRLSFRRFLGLGMDDGTVDHATIALFRKRLHEADLASALFDAVKNHLSKQGLILHEGTCVDATIMQTPTGRPRKSDDLSSSKDRAATHTKKHGRIYHGYKAHVATDLNGMIKGYLLDTAKVHDSVHFEALIQEESESVFADSAYMKASRKQELEDQGVFCGIIERRVRGQGELTKQQKSHNRLCASFRGICEMPFAWLRRAGRKRTRYQGLRKTGMDIGLWAMSYNLWRSLTIKPEFKPV